jgi:hypothetical protein
MSFLKNYRRTGQLLVITAAGDAHRGEFPPPLVYRARDVHPYSSHFSRQMHISLTLPLSVSLLPFRAADLFLSAAISSDKRKRPSYENRHGRCVVTNKHPARVFLPHHRVWLFCFICRVKAIYF